MQARGPAPGVLEASMESQFPTPEGQRIGGVLVVAADAGELRARVVVGDTEVPAEWGLASPRIARRFPAAQNAGHSRFRATCDPGLEGPARLLVGTPEGTEHEVARLVQPWVRPERGYLGVPAVLERLSQRAPGSEAGSDEHARLLAGLGAVPVDQRDRRWLEAMVLANLACGELPRQTFQDLVRLRRAYAEEDDLRGFAALWTEAERVLNGRVLTAHGFEPAMAGRRDDQVWREVAEVCAEIEGRGWQVFLSAGTLLGLVRDGRPIPHDYDADLTVLVPGDSIPDVVERWWGFKEELARAGLLSVPYERTERHHGRIVTRTGLPVDLFPAWVSRGRVHAWPYSAGDVGAEELLPLVREDVTGLGLPVPGDPDPVLVANYGEDWRDPDPVYRFDWLAARARFPDFLAASSARRSRSPLAGGSDPEVSARR